MAACLAEVLRAELVKEVNASPFFSILINPRPEGYGSRFVVHSFELSVHRTTESSAHFFVPVKVQTG